MTRALFTACAIVLFAIAPSAQRDGCPPPGMSVSRLEALRKDGFAMPDAAGRHALALGLTACLGHPDPALRDGVAFEALSAWMRAGALDEPTMVALRTQLLGSMAAPDPDGFRSAFAALVLAEVARTDRITPWMSDADRDLLVRAAALFLARVTDYRAFDDRDGFRHAVAHGADLALQLALNPATSKAQLDHLLLAIASQVSPQASVAYWAGEPDRLARPVVFIAQRNLHSDREWRSFFGEITNPKPLSSWKVAFTSELGIKKRHNVRAFLLSVLATAMTSEEPGVRMLAGPARDALKTVP